MIFYNPKVSAIKFELSILKSTIQLEIAPALNPNSQGRPAPGEKVYDWDNSGYFSISSEEAVKLVYYWDKIRRGEYQNPNPSKPEYANQYTITHYSGGQGNKSPNHLTFKPAEINGKLTGSVTISLHVGSTKGNFFYPLRKEEQVIVQSFLEKGFKDLPYDVALLGAIEKKKRYDEQKGKTDNRGGNNNRGSNYNNSSNNQGSNNYNSDFVPPPQAQTPANDPFGDDIGGFSNSQTTPTNNDDREIF